MPENILIPFGGYAVFFVMGLIFIIIPVVLGRLLRPRRPTWRKGQVYECGEPTIGSSWIRYNLRFYATALDFLIFDVEVVLLIPVMLAVRQIAMAAGAEAGFIALSAIAIFYFLLALGLAYAWRYGTIEWVVREDAAARPETPEPAPAAHRAA